MARSLVTTIEAANAALLVDGDLDAIGEFFAPDYAGHLTDRDIEGHAAIRRFLVALRRALPDLEVEVEILLRGENRVAWQRRLRGAHTGDYAGFPATGRTIVWRDMLTSRFRRGLIAEEWAVSELAERLLLARKR